MHGKYHSFSPRPATTSRFYRYWCWHDFILLWLSGGKFSRFSRVFYKFHKNSLEPLPSDLNEEIPAEFPKYSKFSSLITRIEIGSVEPLLITFWWKISENLETRGTRWQLSNLMNFRSEQMKFLSLTTIFLAPKPRQSVCGIHYTNINNSDGHIINAIRREPWSGWGNKEKFSIEAAIDNGSGGEKSLR